MINRSIIRVRVLQQLYASEYGQNRDLKSLEQTLFASFEKTYDLYIYLIELVDALTELHAELTEVRRNKFLASNEELKPNMRLINNQLFQKISNASKFNQRVTDNGLSWRGQETLLRQILNDIISSDLYEKYLQSPDDSFEADADFWIEALRDIAYRNEHLDEYLEEVSLYWDNPCDIIEKIDVEEMPEIEVVDQVVDELKGSEYYSAFPLTDSAVETAKRFALRTLRRLNPNPEENLDDVLIPIFRDEYDEEFARQLLHHTYLNAQEYDEKLDHYYRNWDQERIASMDAIVMRTAMAEALNFPQIPLSVTINEYINLAKEYSTSKSGQFVNGVLDSLFSDLRKEKKLLK